MRRTARDTRRTTEIGPTLHIMGRVSFQYRKLNRKLNINVRFHSGLPGWKGGSLSAHRAGGILYVLQEGVEIAGHVAPGP